MNQNYSEQPLFVAKSSVNALLRFYMLSSFYITITLILYFLWKRYSPEFNILGTKLKDWPPGTALGITAMWIILAIHFIRRIIECAKRFRLYELSHFMITSRKLRYRQWEELRLVNILASYGMVDLPLEKITDKSCMSVFEDYGTITLSTSSTFITRDYMYMPQNVMDIISESKDTYRYETGTIKNIHLENSMVQGNMALNSQLENMAKIMENISGKMSLEQNEPEKIEEHPQVAEYAIADEAQQQNEEAIDAE